MSQIVITIYPIDRVRKNNLCRVLSKGLSPPALSSAPAQREWGGRLRERIRERGKREPPAFSNYFKHWLYDIQDQLYYCILIR